MGLVPHAKRRHAVSVIWGLLGVAVTPKESRGAFVSIKYQNVIFVSDNATSRTSAI